MFRFRFSSSPWPAAPAVLLLVTWLLAVSATRASDFPPVSAAEKAMTQVDWDPSAPAVVLFEEAELHFMDYPRDVSSYMDVKFRIKVLKEEGKAYGEAAIYHSAFERLSKLKGRILQPDGTQIELADEHVFEERRSKARNAFVTKISFPGVQVGSIIDYSYTTRWDTYLFLEPWYFNNPVPTLRSRISFFKPKNMALQPWAIQTGRAEFQVEQSSTPKGNLIQVTLENVPSVPAEPISFPVKDLASKFMMITKEVASGGSVLPILDSWNTVGDLFEREYYGPFRRKGRGAKTKAKALTSGLKDPREKAEALFRFVRDEIRTDSSSWILVGEKGIDRVLDDRSGTYAEKAVLLQAMLDAVRIDADLVWAADRREGRIDTNVANPWFFDTVLVRAEIGKEEVYLDPCDYRVGFGHLAPYHEGMPALVLLRKPEVVTLPTTPWEANTRQADVSFELDEEGRLTGSGMVRYDGHHAWARTGLGGSDEEALEIWEERLAEDFEGFDITDLELSELPDQRRLEVSFRLAQREEEVLGDETTLLPSRPLGPVDQPFDLEPHLRRTPVQIDFADRDEVRLTLRWPEGWELESLPQASDFANQAGALRTSVEVDESGRTLEYSRQFDITSQEFVGGIAYTSIRNLYNVVARNDAQELVLIQP